MNKVLRSLLHVPASPVYLGLSAVGYAWFLLSGKTPVYCFEGMRRLYFVTNGRSNDWFLALARKLRPAPPIPEVCEGILGRLTRQDVIRIADTLREQGYFVPTVRLSEELLAEIRNYAATTPCHPMEGYQRKPETVMFDASKATAVRYDYDLATLLKAPVFQRIAADPTLLAVAQAYWGCAMLFDHLGLWWSVPSAGGPDTGAAQLHHVDMDRINWLNFFIYISDVGPDNGPHCYVARSHRRKPRTLLRPGRIHDDEIASAYPAEDIKEFVGPAGTIIIEDTRGHHKGVALRAGSRLMFEAIFTSSLFGANYQKSSLQESELTPELRDAFARDGYAYREIEVVDEGAAQRA
jgi:hypothetical protein